MGYRFVRISNLFFSRHPCRSRSLYLPGPLLPLPDNWRFNLAPGNSAKIFPGILISSVAAADFNHDGYLDLLVQGLAAEDNSTTVLQIWLGDLKNLST